MRACPATASGRESFPRSAGSPGSAETHPLGFIESRSPGQPSQRSADGRVGMVKPHLIGDLRVCQLIIDNRIRRRFGRAVAGGLWRESRRVPAWAGDSSVPLLMSARAAAFAASGLRESAPLSGYVTSLR